MSSVQIHPSWKALLQPTFEQPYMASIKSFILNERSKGKRVFPAGTQIFHAFNLTPLEKVKVVILGQDPYHGAGQAMGLSFSVPRGVKPPPSLVNIYKELETDLDIAPATHGDLTAWAERGVLLLNAILTVNENEPGSHRAAGWEMFTDTVIQKISDEKTNVVFMLWGNFAKQKANLINAQKHLILQAPHPSPFSAHNGFFGCQHFSKANAYLHEMVDWRLPT